MDNRYFFNQIAGDTVRLRAQEMSHLVKVRRAKVGDKITGFNGDGFDYQLTIQSISKDSVDCHIDERKPNPATNDRDITVYLAMVKNDALALALDHLAELNVKRVCLFKSERSVALVDEKKLVKLNQNAIQSSKQSERADIMKIELIKKSDIKADIMKYQNRFFAYENSTEKIKPFSGDFAVVVGAEGGFSAEERDYFSSFCTPISLGKLILRAELASVVSVASLKAVSDEG